MACAKHAETTKIMADFAVVARIEITAFTLSPSFSPGTSLPDHNFNRTAISIEEQIHSVMNTISSTHVSVNIVGGNHFEVRFELAAVVV